MKMGVNLCGIELKNPVIAASGTFGFGREYDKFYNVADLGGISVKGLTRLPRLGNRNTLRHVEFRGTSESRRGSVY